MGRLIKLCLTAFLFVMFMAFSVRAIAWAYYGYAERQLGSCNETNCVSLDAMSIARHLKPIDAAFFWLEAKANFRAGRYLDAARYYQEYTKREPLDAYGWGNVVFSMLASHRREGAEIDMQTFSTAWDRMLLTGGTEQVLQLTVVERGLIHWNLLNSKQRHDVLAVAEQLCSYMPALGSHFSRRNFSSRALTDILVARCPVVHVAQ